MIDSRLTLAIIGGTGKEGAGLALRWAQAGHGVILGSRSREKAADAARELNAILGQQRIRGTDNLSAATEAATVVLTVPYTAQRRTVTELRPALVGKLLIDVTVPLVAPRVGTVQLPMNGSAIESIQRYLGTDVRVVSAFQNVAAHHLKNLKHTIECDVLVCSDDREAAELTIRLARDAGLRAVYAGPLKNSLVAEALTSVLITINQNYKVLGAGIRITGVPGLDVI